MNLRLLDTAGRERFPTPSMFFYRGAFAIIICIDLTNRESLKTAPKWFEEAKKPMVSTGVIPFIIVGTKADLKDKRVITANELQELAVHYDSAYIEVSAKSGANVDELMTTLIQTIPKDFLQDEFVATETIVENNSPEQSWWQKILSFLF
jgi:small GTP-binding protein